MNTEENNKLIAEFMGVNVKMCGIIWAICDTNGNLVRTAWSKNKAYEMISREMNFNSSWSWLIPVVEKCFAKWEFQSNDGQNRFCGWYKDNDGCMSEYTKNVSIGDTSKESHYKAVVEFIKWYNENK